MTKQLGWESPPNMDIAENATVAQVGLDIASIYIESGY